MFRQVGDLKIKNGFAMRGLLIRHLIFPNDLSATRNVIDFIVDELSPNSYLNLMDQYYPTHRAFDFPELSRRLRRKEYVNAVDYALEKGIHRGIPFDYL